MKVVLVPGWHEASDLMWTFAHGRHGKPGFEAMGFECEVFPQGHDGLRRRIERFNAFLVTLRRREPDAFPVVTFGYSAGGLINRGFLRAYPEKADWIAATVQVATPNFGLISNYLANTMRMLGVDDDVLSDLDVASEFMTWLNGTSGHWVPTERKDQKRWVLDRQPWLAPEGHRILHIVGQVPRYNKESDGVVMVESATLDGVVPSAFVADPMANHINLGGIFNLLTFVLRGFWTDDRMWSRSVEIASRFYRGEALA